MDAQMKKLVDAVFGRAIECALDREEEMKKSGYTHFLSAVDSLLALIYAPDVSLEDLQMVGHRVTELIKKPEVQAFPELSYFLSALEWILGHRLVMRTIQKVEERDAEELALRIVDKNFVALLERMKKRGVVTREEVIPDDATLSHFLWLVDSSRIELLPPLPGEIRGRYRLTALGREALEQIRKKGG